MKYINTFKNHASYEEKLNGGGGRHQSAKRQLL